MSPSRPRPVPADASPGGPLRPGRGRAPLDPDLGRGGGGARRSRERSPALLDRDPAAERHRRAAHGARAQQHDPGRADPHAAHGRRRDALDLRHRPRRHRHPGGGREGAGRRGHLARRARPRGVRAPGLGVAGAVRRADHRAVQAAGRLPRLRARALHPGRGLRGRGPAGLRGPLREGLHLPRPLHGQLGPRAWARRSPTSRSRTARSPTRSSRSPTRSPTGAGRSWSPRCAPRRCSPTPPSR